MRVFDLLNLYLENVRVVLFDINGYKYNLLYRAYKHLSEFILKDDLKDFIMLNDNNNYEVINFYYDNSFKALVIFCDLGVN